MNLASPQRRKRHGSTDDDGSSSAAGSVATSVSSKQQQQQQKFRTDFGGLLRRHAPAPPAQLIRRLGARENPGVGKVSLISFPFHRIAFDVTTKRLEPFFVHRQLFDTFRSRRLFLCYRSDLVKSRSKAGR